MSDPRRLRRRDKVFAVAAGAVVLVVVLEVGLRVVGWLVAPAPPAAADPAEFTILCEGDSFTFGVSGISFPAQLEEILNARAGSNRFRVINAAIPGANTNLLADGLPARISHYRPDVVLVTTGENNSWNSVRLPERDAGAWGRVQRGLLQLKVVRLALAARAGWSQRSFHDGAPRLSDQESGANYLFDEHLKNFDGVTALMAREEPREDPPAYAYTEAQRDRIQAAYGLANQLRFEESVQVFQGLIEEAPDSIDLYLGLYESLMRLDRTAEAAVLMRRALYETPGIVHTEVAWHEVGMALDLDGRHDEAVEAWVDGLRRYPRSRSIFLALGNSFWRRGKSVWRVLEETRGVAGIEENLLHRYLSRLAVMSEGYASDPLREFVSESLRADTEKIVAIGRDAGVRLVFSSYPEHAYPEVEQVAASRGVPYIDFRTVFAARFEDRSRYIGADGFHCNTAGYRLMAEVFAQGVLEVLELDLPPLSEGAD